MDHFACANLQPVHYWLLFLLCFYFIVRRYHLFECSHCWTTSVDKFSLEYVRLGSLVVRNVHEFNPLLSTDQVRPVFLLPFLRTFYEKQMAKLLFYRPHNSVLLFLSPFCRQESTETQRDQKATVSKQGHKVIIFNQCILFLSVLFLCVWEAQGGHFARLMSLEGISWLKTRLAYFKVHGKDWKASQASQKSLRASTSRLWMFLSSYRQHQRTGILH